MGPGQRVPAEASGMRKGKAGFRAAPYRNIDRVNNFLQEMAYETPEKGPLRGSLPKRSKRFSGRPAGLAGAARRTATLLTAGWNAALSMAGPMRRQGFGRARRAACWRSAECARRRFRIRLREPPWREQGPYARRHIHSSRKRHPRRVGNPMCGGVSRNRPHRLSKAVYPSAYAVPRRGRRFSFPAHARFSLRDCGAP